MVQDWWHWARQTNIPACTECCLAKWLHPQLQSHTLATTNIGGSFNQEFWKGLVEMLDTASLLSSWMLGNLHNLSMYPKHSYWHCWRQKSLYGSYIPKILLRPETHSSQKTQNDLLCTVWNRSTRWPTPRHQNHLAWQHERSSCNSSASTLPHRHAPASGSAHWRSETIMTRQDVTSKSASMARPIACIQYFLILVVLGCSSLVWYNFISFSTTWLSIEKFIGLWHSDAHCPAKYIYITTDYRYCVSILYRIILFEFQ